VCLALIALEAHPQLPLVIAANRDEFHARAAVPAHWWDDGTLAGVDLEGGGTWLGVTRAGRWALVTNYREGAPRDPKAPSRGMLVTRALAERTPPLVCAANIAADGRGYHGYNLLLGEVASAAYTSNRASGAVALGAGIHGLSNHLLDTPWPKVVHAKQGLSRCLASEQIDVESLFALLADRRQAEPAALPTTGIAPEWERLLSSAFIVDARYGTRCSTVLIQGRDGSARFVERSFDAQGRLTGEIAHQFARGAA
jgi:uncharacterized protein with NRDE domain